MKFEKEIVRPGTYVIDGKRHTIDPDRLKRWADNHAAMTAAGLRIPAPFKHDPAAVPVAQGAGDSRDNAGYWEKLFIDDKGNLRGIIDVEVPELAERIGKSFKECSLQSKNAFTDGSGKTWEDCLTHVALVTHPVVAGQENFKPLADDTGLSFSLAQLEPVTMGDDESPRLTSLSLSEDLTTGECNFHGSFKKEGQPATNLLAKFKSIVETLRKGEPVYLNNRQAVSMSLTPVAEPMALAIDGNSVDVGSVLSVLKDLGIELPDDTTYSNLIERTFVAGKALLGSKAKQQQGNGLTILPGGVTMAHKIEADSPQGKQVLKAQREKLTNRIQALVDSGRISAQYVKDVLESQIAECRMSLEIDDDGNLGGTSLDPVLSALERLPELGAANGKKIKDNGKGDPQKVGSLSLALGDDPNDAAEITPEQAEEIANRIYKNVGYSVPAPAAAS